MHRSSDNQRRWHAGAAIQALLGGVSIAVLLSAGSVAARADDSVTIEEIKQLKAQLKMLEHRMDAQAKETKVLRAAAAGPVTKGPYSPPLPWDKKFHLNGITITPGGFFDLTGVFRTRFEGADSETTMGSIPAYTAPNAHMNEFRLSARGSRASLLIEGAINPSTMATGYFEGDFLGAANTANSNYTNSYNLRVRQMYSTVDWNDVGFHVLAGQIWSLTVLQGAGMKPRNEIIPATLGTAYNAGFTYTRQPGIRLTKNFDGGFAVAVAAEMSQTTGCPGNTVDGGLGGATVYCNLAGGTNLNSTTTYSFNKMPDVIAKAAWDGKIADRNLHVEGFGLFTEMSDEVSFLNNTSGNSINKYDTAGWGAGGGVTFQALPKLIDLQGSAMIGRGIGRYGASNLTNAELGYNGAFVGLPEIMYLGGATVHATPQLDLFVYGGAERILNSDYNAGNASNYGANPLTGTNAGCTIVGGTCNGATESTWEVTGGLWDKIYEGAFGSVRVGLQYSYIEREIFSEAAASGALPAVTGPVWFNDQQAFASLRYYPFDAPPPAPALVSKY